MLQYLKGKRGQSTLEYAVLICVIIGALVAVQTYVKRGVQGRLKSASDDIGDQFSPNNMNVISSSVRWSNTEESMTAGNSTSNLYAESTNSGMNAVMLDTSKEYWGS